MIALLFSIWLTQSHAQSCRQILKKVSESYIHPRVEGRRYALTQRDGRYLMHLITTQPDPGVLTLRFVSSKAEDEAYIRDWKDEAAIQKRFNKDVRRRALLLAEALRGREGINEIHFAWNSDQFSWRDFEDLMVRSGWPRNPAPLNTEGTWLNRFLRRRKFRHEVLSGIKMPDLDLVGHGRYLRYPEWESWMQRVGADSVFSRAHVHTD